MHAPPFHLATSLDTSAIVYRPYDCALLISATRSRISHRCSGHRSINAHYHQTASPSWVKRKGNYARPSNVVSILASSRSNRRVSTRVAGRRPPEGTRGRAERAWRVEDRRPWTLRTNASLTPAIAPYEKSQSLQRYFGRRTLHTGAFSHLKVGDPPTQNDVLPIFEPPGGIRSQLRQWQDKHREENDIFDRLDRFNFPVDEPDPNGPGQNHSRMGDDVDTAPADDSEQDNVFLDAGSQDFDDTHTASGEVLNKGDLVAISRDGRLVLAIFLERQDVMRSRFYNINGALANVRASHVVFVIRSWVPVSLVDPIMPYVPNDVMRHPLAASASKIDHTVPREIGAPLTSKMLRFEEEAASLYRVHASVLDNAHELLAHREDLRYSTIQSVAMYLLRINRDQVTRLVEYVVYQALAAAGFAFFMDSKTTRVTGLVQIRPKRDVQAVDSTVEWIREWQQAIALSGSGKSAQLPESNPIPDFLLKMRRLVLQSRETRDPSPCGTIGPSKIKLGISESQSAVKVIKLESFDWKERHILNFFRLTSNPLYSSEADGYHALTSVLLRALGLYDDHELDPDTCHLFLQELGVLLPYENPVEQDPLLALPTGKHSKPLLNLTYRLLRAGKDGFKFEDSMSDLRHDWGELPVYCVDGPMAREIDDGFSIEPGNTASQRWIRIHIANPTAFLSQDMDISKMARHMGETLYMPDRNHMMLPPRATQHWWSLAPDRPTLTFSALIDNEGRILETEIRPGRIHKVVSITYEELQKILDPTSTSSTGQVLVVGGEVPPDQHARQVAKPTEKQIAELQDIYRVAESRYSFRAANGGVNQRSAKPKSTASVWTRWARSGLEFIPYQGDCARRVLGDPIIRVTLPAPWTGYADKIRMDSEGLVQEMMLLACETASSWCAQRQIPQLHRRSGPLPGGDPQEHWRNVCEPIMEKHGELPQHIMAEHMATMGSVEISTTPGIHRFLGLDNFCKCTSPLRRYGDMVSHWQIESALRQEATLGRSLVTQERNPDRSFLPFSSQGLVTFARGYHLREKLITLVKKKAEDFWHRLLLIRALHFGEAEISNICTVYIDTVPNTPHGFFRGDIRENVLRCDIAYAKTLGIDDVMKFGDIWQCRIEKVTRRTIEVAPMQLLQRLE